MSWMIVRAITGEKFMCKTDANFADAVMNRKAVQINDVFEVVTLNMPSHSGVGRLTRLAELDFNIGQSEDPMPLPSMMIVPAAWYQIEDELAKEIVDDLAESKKKAVEMAAAANSPLSLAEAVLPPGFDPRAVGR